MAAGTTLTMEKYRPIRPPAETAMSSGDAMSEGLTWPGGAQVGGVVVSADAYSSGSIDLEWLATFNAVSPL